ncbi:MAG: serpin family protein [Planctomycetaceae bacterium]|nr:PDZ domain-containing protein [Planctomycetaceae bacterium]
MISLKSACLLCVLVVARPVATTAEPWSQPLNAFSLRLSQARFAADEQEQSVLSPVSIWLALNFMREGTGGETRQQMDQFLTLSTAQASELNARLRELRELSVSRYFLGVEAKNNKGYGLLISRVLPDSPADRAGIAVGDLLLEINGAPVNSETNYGRVMDQVAEQIEAMIFSHAEGRLRPLKIKLKPVDTQRFPGVLMANGLWNHATLPLRQEFLDSVSSKVQPAIFPLPEKPADAAEAINRWLSTQLDETTKALDAEMLSDDVKFVLINALAFKGQWIQEFDRQDTRPRDFHLADGTTTRPHLMHANRTATFSAAENWKCLGLMFQGGSLQLLCFLPPPAEAPATTRQALLPNVEEYNRLVAGLQSTPVDILLPRLSVSSEYLSLEKFLPTQGLALPFDRARADFSILSDASPVYISQMFQKADFTMDETGATAKAVTGAIAKPRMTLADPGPEFHADRPFSFVLRDTTSDLILFAGQVWNPSDAR